MSEPETSFFTKDLKIPVIAFAGTPGETDGPLPSRRAAPVNRQQGSQHKIRGFVK